MKAEMSRIKPGDYLIPDGGFTCMKEGVPVEVHSSGTLFVHCNEGRHYLDGQLDNQGYLVGLSRKDCVS